MRSLDIAMLRTFDALMRERSVSRAAARLFLSQPAVSASLKRLREVFDDRLFTRTAHGVVPTALALSLQPRVLSVLDEMSKLLNADRRFAPATSDRILRVAGSDHTSRMMLPSLCATLNAAGSRIRIFWEAANYASLLERIGRGDVDLGLMPRVSAPLEVEAELLYEDTYVAAARRGHPLFADGMAIDSFCAAPQVFLGYGRSALDDQIDQVLSRAGRRRHNQVAVTSFTQMVDLLSLTDHVAVLPSRVAARHADALDAWPLPFDLAGYGLYVCWDRRSNEDPAVQWLRHEIVALGTASRG